MHDSEQRTAAFYSSIAHDYDAMMAKAPSHAWTRDAFREFVGKILPPPARVLDFGAGTGTDAIWYAQHGYHVTVQESSPGMLRRLNAKLAEAGFSDDIAVHAGPLSSNAPALSVDGVVANFAVLNLLHDLLSVFEVLAGIVRPGGHVIISVMNPLFWKDLAHPRGWSGALRVLSRGAIHVDGPDTDVYWYRVAAIVRAARPAFVLRARGGVGTLVRRFSGSHDWNDPIGMSERLERRMWRHFPMTWLGRWFFLALERQC